MGALLWTEVLIPAARWQVVILGRLGVRLTGQIKLTGVRTKTKVGFKSTQNNPRYTHTHIYITHTHEYIWKSETIINKLYSQD